MSLELFVPTVSAVAEITGQTAGDCLILVGDGKELLGGVESVLGQAGASVKSALEQRKAVDEGALEGVSVFGVEGVPGGRVVLSTTGPLDRDYDDVRRFFDAGCKAMKRAVKAGAVNPVLAVLKPAQQEYTQAVEVAALGMLHGIYAPLEQRQHEPEKCLKVKAMSILGSEEQAKQVAAIEAGKVVARDVGGGDPEVMAPLRVWDYVRTNFEGSAVKATAITDINTLNKSFPLLMAVARCSMVVERHHPCVITLDYVPEGEVKDTIILVGKGVTYDTGGLDIKAGGIMAGMHRDKCGAAAVAGLMKTVALLRPAGIRVIGHMSMVRNSCGADGYVADEVIVSRAGRRVRVVHTDAEGRMAMADVLCLAKEQALETTNAKLFTIATLTGHAKRTVGGGYSIACENKRAKQLGIAASLQSIGEANGDPFEVSNVRREDFDNAKSEYGTEDVMQLPMPIATKATVRGHQFPVAFHMAASGLDDHMASSSSPISYTHLDIAGSALEHPELPSAAPVTALAAFLQSL